MGVIITPESALGKELAKWNTPRNQFVRGSDGEILKELDGSPVRGMNCIGYEEYPKMLYQARTLPNGQTSVGEVAPHPMYCATPQEFEQKSLFVEGFNRSCQKIVRDEAEERLAKGQGWCNKMGEALERHEKDQQYIAQIAAEEAFKRKRMSAKAQAEFAAAEDQTEHHVVDIKPAKKRGRKPKAVAPVAAE